METPVTGGSTPLSLGDLRQAILAVYVGNPRFSAAEQLEANHDAHACEDMPYLVAWLKGARLEDAKRGREAHLLALNTKAHQQAVCYDEQVQAAELVALLQCRGLHPHQRSASLLLIGDRIYTPAMRVRLLGDAYFALLHNVGYHEPTNRCYPGLLSN